MRNKSSGEKLSIGPLFFCVSYDALFFFLLFLKLMHCQHFHFIAFSGDFSIPALSFLNKCLFLYPWWLSSAVW